MQKAGDGNRTRILGLENQYNNRYTTPAFYQDLRNYNLCKVIYKVIVLLQNHTYSNLSFIFFSIFSLLLST